MYNGLIFLSGIFPGASVALGIILLTVLIKLILSPFYKKSIVSQIKQRELKPFIDEIKKKYPDKKEQAKKTFELYKQHKTNPFSGCLPVIVQIIVILGLFNILRGGFILNENIIYSFIHTPESFNLHFLGINIQEKNLILAVLAGLSQFIHMRFSPQARAFDKEPKTKETSENPSFQESPQASMKD